LISFLSQLFYYFYPISCLFSFVMMNLAKFFLFKLRAWNLKLLIFNFMKSAKFLINFWFLQYLLSIINFSMMESLVIFAKDHLTIIIVFDYFIKMNWLPNLAIPISAVSFILYIPENSICLIVCYFFKIHCLSILNSFNFKL